MKNVLLTFSVVLVFQITAFTQETDLDSYHNCWGTVFETEQEGIRGALSFLSPTQSECRNGTAVLAIKKFKKRVQNQAEFEITDTLGVRTDCPENCLYITRCEDNGGNFKEYILLIKTEVLSDEFFNSFIKSWTYNANLKIIDASHKTLTCVNKDYGA